jgi:hypothetical protein
MSLRRIGEGLNCERCAMTVFGGHEQVLRHTLTALEDAVVLLAAAKID